MAKPMKKVLNPAGLTPRQAHALAQKKQFTPKQVYECARWALTLEEAAGLIGVHRSTLSRRLREDAYREAWVLGQANSLRRIREVELEAAIKDRNPRLLIKFGRLFLGQKSRDVPPASMTIEDNDGTVYIRWDDDLEKEYQDALAMDVEHDVIDVSPVESGSTDSGADSDPEA